MKLEDIRKLCEAATPRPWTCWVKGDDHHILTRAGTGNHPLVDVIADLGKAPPSWSDPPAPMNNARFIACARSLLPKLLALADQVKSDVEFGRDVPDSIVEKLADVEAWRPRDEA